MTKRLNRILILSFWAAMILNSSGCLRSTQKKVVHTREKIPLKDVIPLTAGNIRGHATLYREGWTVISSSSKALDYAARKSIESSNNALRNITREYSGHTKDYYADIKNDIVNSFSTGKEALAYGKDMSGRILETTHSVAKYELGYANDKFKNAVDKFVKGNISLSERTGEDFKELLTLPGNLFNKLKRDFSNIGGIVNKTNKQVSRKISLSWEKSFKRASQEFKSEYEKSSKKGNALTALGPILHGYLKALYHGIAAPVSKALFKTTVSSATHAVFLPIATGTVVAGRTIQSIGLTFYYVGKTGVKIVSPTVEGGLLGGMALLSLGSIPATYTAGGSLGAMNQVAFTALGPAYAGGKVVTTTAVDTGKYVCFVTYDTAKTATIITINQASSGVVLGYNALTALPTHTLMGVSDAAVFLAWDGPRLVVALAQGKVGTGTGKVDKGLYSIGNLPVGSVVDLKELENTEGIKTRIISEDPEVIKKVIEELPKDLRRKMNNE
ncbi:MAG: hypothetical protein ACMUJM_23465 [bacterium]